MFRRNRMHSFWYQAVALLMAYVIALCSIPVSLRADTLSNNTLKVLSDNNITVRDNTFYTPISVANNVSVVLQMAGGPWEAVAGAVFSLISGQMAKDDSNKRFDEISQQLRLISQQLKVMDAKLDRIDLALRLISDKDDEILDAVHAVPAHIAYVRVLADIGLIQDHWDTWTKSRFALFAAKSDMRFAYDNLTRDAAALYTQEDPSYTAPLAMSLRLSIDLANKLGLGGQEIADLKKGYKRFFDAALAPPAPGIEPGEAVNATDSFPGS